MPRNLPLCAIVRESARRMSRLSRSALGCASRRQRQPRASAADVIKAMDTM
jgi:hypothetical protein